MPKQRSQKLTNPRLVAADYLHKTLGRVRNDSLLSSLSSQLSLEDKRLSYHLIRGVERHRRYLEHLLHYLAQRPISSISKHLKINLLLGLLQIIFLEKIPDYAAVSENVNLLAKKRQKERGFINAILREAVRKKNKLPPIPASPLARNLSIKYSFPHWLVKDTIDFLGKDQSQELFKNLNETTELSATINTLKTTPAEILEKLKTKEVAFKFSAIFNDSIHLPRKELEKIYPFINEGLLYIQNESSRCAVELMQVKPEERVIDSGAAPGGKSFLIQQYCQNQARLISIESNEQRIDLIKENLARLNVKQVNLEQKDASKTVAPSESVDKVLIDPPCSSLGITRNHPDIKWRHGKKEIKQFAKQQLQFLESAADALKSGGYLVYSVCTFTKEETVEVIEQFLKKYQNFSKENEFSLLPKQLWQYFRKDGTLLILPSNLHPLDPHFCCGLRKN